MSGRSARPTQPGRVLAGRVIKPHGIRGEVVVEVLTERLERFDPGGALFGDGRPMAIVSSRPHQGRMLLKFEGVADRSDAERLRGMLLEVDPVSWEDSEAYLVSELVGMRVLSEDGRDLGVVQAVVELPAAAEYDLLEVSTQDGTTWLLPATEEYVEVDEDEEGHDRLVVVAPPEGLLPGQADEQEVVPPEAPPAR